MKFFCDIEGLEGNWIEFQKVWTRAEMNEVSKNSSAGEEETLALLRSKAVACHLVAEDGTTVTDPQKITSEFLDGVRGELIGFLSVVLDRAVRRIKALGNAAVRLWSDSNEATTKAALKSQTS